MHESEKWKRSHSVVSDSVWPHGLQPTRLLCPWDFPGKSTGVGCHRLLPSGEEQQVKVITWHAGKRWWKLGKTSHRIWWPKWDYRRSEPGEKRQRSDRGHSLCHCRGASSSMAHGRVTIWNSWSHFCADWINQATWWGGRGRRREKEGDKGEWGKSEERVREEASCSHWIWAHLAMSFMGRRGGGHGLYFNHVATPEYLLTEFCTLILDDNIGKDSKLDYEADTARILFISY